MLWPIVFTQSFGFDGWTWVLIASVPDLCILPTITVLIVHRIVLFKEPDRCFQDGGQENRREVGTYFITILSVY